ncbi:hypothetical protein [Rhodococcus sp. ZPP]|uniref:hypothetical protein n=1 Tax=Rhodococcus sp. ZPP TaxID=2749906 RepID=UPI001FCC7F9A|nr:hypothetical protein [Rhodococcus sp. ZPP]
MGRVDMDELDSKNLGRLRRIADARSVWTYESGNFTPWLAENIDVLADALEMITACDRAHGALREREVRSYRSL